MSGLNMAMLRVSRLLLALVSVGVDAAEPGKPPPNDLAPSLELLEFLGEWQTARGEFVDPLQLQDVDVKDVGAKANVERGDRHD